jgi:hypothetical protein
MQLLDAMCVQETSYTRISRSKPGHRCVHSCLRREPQANCDRSAAACPLYGEVK